MTFTGEGAEGGFPFGRRNRELRVCSLGTMDIFGS